MIEELTQLSRADVELLTNPNAKWADIHAILKKLFALRIDYLKNQAFSQPLTLTENLLLLHGNRQGQKDTMDHIYSLIDDAKAELNQKKTIDEKTVK